MINISTDYLVVGAGAVGLAFVDALISASTDERILIVDQRAKPGGHWNDAYSFVNLHQPSSHYGVNSMQLGSGRKDTHGPNEGFYELASGAEVTAYFDAVMNQRLLPSGRVTYLPMTNFVGGNRVVSLLSGSEMHLAVRKKVVDSTYLGTQIPATHTPKFQTAKGVKLISPGQLTKLGADITPPNRYVVLGAGKTGMDVNVWLVASGVDPDRIIWVMPRDSWVFNRRRTQPGIEFFVDTIGGQVHQMKAFAQARDATDLFNRLETADVMIRVDQSVQPSMFHYATISEGEVQALRKIRNVIRNGRLKAIDERGLQFESEHVPVEPDALYIDCTASAVEKKAPVPIFQDGKVIPQLVRAPFATLSAAIVGWVEGRYSDDATKNELCRPVSFPDRPEQYPATILGNMRNEGAWKNYPELREWLKDSRLEGFQKLVASVDPTDSEKQSTLSTLRKLVPDAAANLQRLAGCCDY